MIQTHRLTVFAPAPHDHIRRTLLLLLGLLMCPVSPECIFGRPKQARHSTSRVPHGQAASRTHKVLLGILIKIVGTFDLAFGRVDIREVHDCTGMTGIEYRCKAGAGG